MSIKYVSENMTFKTQTSVNEVPLLQFNFDGVGNGSLKCKIFNGNCNY